MASYKSTSHSVSLCFVAFLFPLFSEFGLGSGGLSAVAGADFVFFFFPSSSSSSLSLSICFYYTKYMYFVVESFSGDDRYKCSVNT